MKQSIVITTIFPPSDAVTAFASRGECELFVVGDAKTPDGWHCHGAQFLPVESQAAIGPSLARHLPHNHYCRKMFGYLRAAAHASDVIIDTDDDNIPKLNWRFPEFDGVFELIRGPTGFVNIYQWFTDAAIWPRGLPLDLITHRFDVSNTLAQMPSHVGVWQGLADDDPDVDAIYRLTSDRPCHFKSRSPIVLDRGVICPFNSQNTAIRRELFPLLYLPAHVTFRFTDILRGLVAQPIMWLSGYRLGFIEATVVQKRNPHDYMKDFVSEIPMFLNCRRVIDIVSAEISPDQGFENNLHKAYAGLLRAGIVCDAELLALDAWLSDLSRHP
jgi:hypothetical protein